MARAIACRSNAPNLSIKTAVISATPASNNLMINYWQSPSLLLSHTFSLSVCLSVSPFPHSFSFPKIRHRLQHESCRPVFGSVTSDFAAGAMPPLPFNGISSLSLTLSLCPSYLPTLCCYGTCQVATGTLISPLIRLLNPGVDSIQPSFMSEKSRSKTPCCLTLQKLTGVSLPSLPSSLSSSRKTLYFLQWK